MYSNLNTDDYRNGQLIDYLKETDQPRQFKKQGDVFKGGKWYNRAWDGEKIIYKPVKP